MGQLRNAHRILVKKPEGKALLERRRVREKYNIKMDLKEVQNCLLGCTAV
jgi:hypothetical protein